MTEPNDFTPYDPAGLPAPRPPRPPAPGHLVGQAQGVQLRSESDRYVAGRLVTVLGFRLQVAGSPQPVEVELRGPTLTDTVRDGDWVEVPDRPAATGLYSVSAVTNVTTGIPVTAKGPERSRALTVIFALVAVFILVVFGIVLVGLLAFDPF